MDIPELITKPNRYETSNFFSRVSFHFMFKFFWDGYGRDLQVSDLWKCTKSDRSQALGNRLAKNWEDELLKSSAKGVNPKTGKCRYSPNLLKAIIKTFYKEFSLWAMLSFWAEVVAKTLQCLSLGWMINALSLPMEDEDRMPRIYWAAAILCGCSAIWIVLQHKFSFEVMRLGMKIRVGMGGLVYRKALRLSRGALGQTTIGQMVNLLSNDVNRFDLSTIFIPYLWMGPMQVALTLAILWPQIGRSSLAGVIILLLFIPFQSYMGKMFSKMRMRTALLTDERVRLMTEIVVAIKVIKMYCWEIPFARMMHAARRAEVMVIKNTAILRAINGALFFVSGKIIVFITLILYLLDGGRLNAYNVFVTISLFNNVRITMARLFPYAFSYGGESLISVSRIKKFLLLQELKDTSGRKYLENAKYESFAVCVNNVTAKWVSEPEDSEEKVPIVYCLNNLNFNVMRQELIVIVGAVGSGKSSILMSILGELPITSGSLTVNGKISYASQEPWIFSGSVRDNILFGEPYEIRKYRKCVHACALERDLSLLPYSDQTVVGDRGASLSGGQKARINLARAIYRDADIYLLDDPLSAVDSNVAKHLFEKCFKTYLRNKTVILVTHQLQFVSQADRVIVLNDDGTIAGCGTFEELQAKGDLDLVKLASESDEHCKEKAKDDKEKDDGLSVRTLSLSISGEISAQAKGSCLRPSEEDKVSWQGGYVDERASIKDEMMESSKDEFKKKPSFADQGARTQKEAMFQGSIKASTYWRYMRAGAGFIMLPLTIISFLLNQFIFTISDWWLSEWTDREKRLTLELEALASGTNETVLPPPAASSISFIDDMSEYWVKLVYTLMIVALFVVCIARTGLFFAMCLRTSINLHKKLFESAIHAKTSFYETTPIGILLNRASRDMGIIDDLLPMTAMDAIEIGLQVIANVILIAYINYYMVIPSLILLALFILCRRFYISSARSLKRVEGVTRSPVFSHLSVSLYGLATIRSFQIEPKFVRMFDYYQDNHTSSWFLFLAASRWLGVVLDWLCCIYITCVTWFLILINAQTTTGGEIGLAISSALMLTGMCQWGVRQATEMESQMTSVERVMEYTKLPSEASFESKPDKKPPKNWPKDGAVEFDEISLTYDPSEPPVLKNLSFKVEPQEKIGIVGRTGAGKSSLISVLFRLVEPSGGQVIIDDIIGNDIGLHDLRSKISIIPQEPVLFTSTLRKNIDPFNEHDDQRLWQVLEEVQLKDAVKELNGGLDAQLSEGGSNFSVGQRQLICLARALVRNNRILVLDEATANVDTMTDALIQHTIREKFRHCTILTVAHRLNTVMDSDKILVLDAGRVIEYDAPYMLLQDPEGHLSNLVKMTGKEMAENLKLIAREAYYKRKEDQISSLILDSNIVDGYMKGLANMDPMLSSSPPTNQTDTSASAAAALSLSDAIGDAAKDGHINLAFESSGEHERASSKGAQDGKEKETKKGDQTVL